MSENILLKVEGMTCGHCVKAIDEALSKRTGVISAWTSLEEKTARESGNCSLHL